MNLGDFILAQRHGPPTDGGFLVPFDYAYELITGDFRPIPPSWWQFWRRASYRRDLDAWHDRVTEYVLTKGGTI